MTWSARTRLIWLRARSRWGMVFAAAATAALTGAYPAQAASGLRAPGLQSPPNRASLQSLPAFQWAVVPGAGSYEFELAADSRFGALVVNSTTHNTAASPDKA